MSDISAACFRKSHTTARHDSLTLVELEREKRQRRKWNLITDFILSLSLDFLLSILVAGALTFINLVVCIPLTNILLSSARRGRIYLPQDELAEAGLSDADIYAGKVTDKWRSFMKDQIKRARMFFDEAEKGVTELSEASRWPVSLTSLVNMKQKLTKI